MYYDSQTGIKHLRGLFSRKAVAVMVALLVVTGAYVAVNYFAPDIFVKNVDEKQAIDLSATTEPPNKDANMLRVPSVGISTPISEKVVEGGVVFKRDGEKLILSAKERVISATPLETVKMSPVYQMRNIANGANIYLDIDGERTVYQVKNVVLYTTLLKTQQYDLTINILKDDNPDTVAVMVGAERMGKMEFSGGQSKIKR